MDDLTHLIGHCKPKNISKWLGDRYGGKWTYDKHYSWHCDDNERRVCRCSALSPQHDGDDDSFRIVYWMYGNGTPVRIWFF